MCLFEYDEEKHIRGEREEGRKEGREEERIRLLIKWVIAGKFTVDEAAKEADMSAEEFEEILKNSKEETQYDQQNSNRTTYTILVSFEELVDHDDTGNFSCLHRATVCQDIY